MLDCLVIGGGPAGLTAAIYLARFRRKAIVIDEGKSRAALIALTHNYPGFAGINGHDLLESYETRPGSMDRLLYQERLVPCHATAKSSSSKPRKGQHTLLLATGLVDSAPPVEGFSALGASCDPIGLIHVDAHQRTSIAGLYAAGDVVSDLHQISVATAHAAIATTGIHNHLAPNLR